MSNVGDNINANIGSWTFGGDVAKTFDDHIQKSVPGYLEGHDLISKLAPFFIAEKGVKCFEMGCSTGALTNKIRSYTSRDDIDFVGIDIEEPMINFANENNKYKNCRYETADVLDYDFIGSSLITSYYTVQFINPSVRQIVIDKIYNSLNWGGAFIFFEKVRGPDARFHDIMQTLYTEYKLDQGYDEKEIIGKTLSLKGILEPFSTNANIEMLQRAGFKDINIIFKKLSFEGYLAIK
jgi:tRNA (cmo5U34)-methyltransferase